jgi:hypothetical protein
MENKQTSAQQDQALCAAPQLRLRTGLRGGESVDSCMKNMQDWQNSYYKWYNQVNVTKPTPCNTIKA